MRPTISPIIRPPATDKPTNGQIEPFSTDAITKENDVSEQMSATIIPVKIFVTIVAFIIIIGYVSLYTFLSFSSTVGFVDNVIV